VNSGHSEKLESCAGKCRAHKTGKEAIYRKGRKNRRVADVTHFENLMERHSGGANLGLFTGQTGTGDSLLVIDIDPRNLDLADAAIPTTFDDRYLAAEARVAYENARRTATDPETLTEPLSDWIKAAILDTEDPEQVFTSRTHRSGRGQGVHILARIPAAADGTAQGFAEDILNLPAGLAGGIDILCSAEKYVMLPGSLHETGGTAVVLEDGPICTVRPSLCDPQAELAEPGRWVDPLHSSIQDPQHAFKTMLHAVEKEANREEACALVNSSRRMQGSKPFANLELLHDLYATVKDYSRCNPAITHSGQAADELFQWFRLIAPRIHYVNNLNPMIDETTGEIVKLTETCITAILSAYMIPMSQSSKKRVCVSPSAVATGVTWTGGSGGATSGGIAKTAIDWLVWQGFLVESRDGRNYKRNQNDAIRYDIHVFGNKGQWSEVLHHWRSDTAFTTAPIQWRTRVFTDASAYRRGKSRNENVEAAASLGPNGSRNLDLLVHHAPSKWETDKELFDSIPDYEYGKPARRDGTFTKTIALLKDNGIIVEADGGGWKLFKQISSFPRLLERLAGIAASALNLGRTQRAKHYYAERQKARRLFRQENADITRDAVLALLIAETSRTPGKVDGFGEAPRINEILTRDQIGAVLKKTGLPGNWGKQIIIQLRTRGGRELRWVDATTRRIDCEQVEMTEAQALAHLKLD